MSTATLKRERPFKKVYDERRAVYASWEALDDEFAKEMIEKYKTVFVATLESDCWTATDQAVKDANFDPPLYLEAVTAHGDWLIQRERKEAAVNEPQSKSVASLQPRFAKMKKLELIDWLIDKWHFVVAKGYSTLSEEVNRADMHLTRAQLVGLCERVWSVL